MELEVTWRRAIKVWWSFLWRNLIFILVAALIGWIVGFVFGFLMTLVGFSSPTIQYVTSPISFIIGLCISIIPIKLILGKNYGEFRLVLVRPSSENDHELAQAGAHNR